MATRTLPDLAAVQAMLERYFVPPATEDRAQQLHAELVAVFANLPRLRGIVSAFHPGNGGRGFGQAWREELAYGSNNPSPIEVAAWLAWSRNIPARPYCPEVFVGRWQQIEPARSSDRAVWEFSADGAFRTTDPWFAKRTHWCVHRLDEAGPVGDAIWLDDALKIAHLRLNVRAIGPQELHFGALGDTITPYRLHRS
jgi:hypothetical protein